MIYIGVDPSTKYVAIVGVHEDDRAVAMLSGLGQESWHVAKLQHARKAVSQFLGMLSPDTKGQALVEAPLVGRGGVGSSFKQAFVTGVILDQLAANGMDVDTINASTWRSELGVRGRGTDQLKANTRLVIERDHPRAWTNITAWFSSHSADQNLIDAAGMALVGRTRGLRPLGQAVDGGRGLPTAETA